MSDKTGKLVTDLEHLYGGTRGAQASPAPGDVEMIKRQITAADTWLDEGLPPDSVYRDNPLANMWRRAYGPVSEAAETQDALIGVTGGNPRKGFCKTSEDMLAEAGDTVASALLFIQSQVKDADITWAYFRRALAKVAGRAGEAGYPS